VPTTRAKKSRVNSSAQEPGRARPSAARRGSTCAARREEDCEHMPLMELSSCTTSEKPFRPADFLSGADTTSHQSTPVKSSVRERRFGAGTGTGRGVG
jgi:hypothetical protein